MESWKQASEGKCPLLYDEMGLPADALGRTRKVPMGWNMKPSCNFDNLLGSNREAIESMEFLELGIPDMMRKSDSSNPSLGVLGGEIGNHFSAALPSPASMITSNSSFGELESGLMFPSPGIASDSQKSSVIDLKLGRLADWREAKDSRFSNKGSVLSSSVGSSLTSKRARMANLYSQNPVCQVHGCNKDLSFSKDYHKRHKVCDVHSKTAKVIVNSVEQRFCQQCSRFHLLAEFDDGKRSCRKRLAGHNERRRKPPLDILSGARFVQTSLPKQSYFIFPDMLPGGFSSPQGNVQGNQFSHIKVEEGTSYSPQLAMLTMDRQSHSKPVFHLHGMGKQYSSENFSSQTGSISLETAASGVSNSSSALSLLSAQSKNLSSQLTGIPMVSPMVTPGTNAHCGVGQNSENFVGVSIVEKFSPNGFCSSGISSMEVNQLGPPVSFDSCSAMDFEFQAGGIFQRSDSMKSRNYISTDQGPTFDLIQLSSHLQRVEQQRNSMQLKQENDFFCSYPNMQGL